MYIDCWGNRFAPFITGMGIGPKELLEKNGVATVHELSGVGSNLQDHLQIRGIYRLKEGTETLNQKYHSIMDNIAMG